MAPIINKALIALLLVSTSISAPLKVRQLAGEGAAADSLLSGTDNAVGYGSEDALDNSAQLISSVTGNSAGNTQGGGTSPPPPHRRQLAGEGAAADSLLSGTDNAVGYGSEDALDNSAQLISSVTGNSASNTQAGSSGGSAPPPPPPPPPHKRQLDKTSAGLQAVGNALGVGSTTSPVTTGGEQLDGTLTGGAANAGAEIADMEVGTAEAVGSSVPTKLPRRQLDKTSAGVQAVGNALGVGSTTAPATSAGESIDGTLTGDAANAGAQAADAEVNAAEQAGSSVPTHL